MKLEISTLRQSFSDDRVSFEDSLFLSAQTQMWIFAAYELLRTWRGRAKKLIALSKTGGLDAKIAALNVEQKHAPVGNLIYAKQLAGVKADPKLVDQIDHDIDLTHVTFGLLSYVRVALAKHETQGSRTGKPSGSSSMGRADRYTGSVQYELTNGPSIWGYVSRRDIAEGIRGFATGIAQSKQELAEFDAYIRGPGPMPDFGGGA